MAIVQNSGSAMEQSRLWSERAADWAAVQEDTFLPAFRSVLDHVAPVAGASWLDVGCGSGRLAELATERGAAMAGLDAAPALVEIARRRTPAASITVGDMEDLPFGDGTFDVVTGFNSFQYAADPVRALLEAKRVARPGAPVVVAIWGTAAECEMTAYLGALRLLMPTSPPGASGPFALSEPGALESLVSEAGLEPESRHAGEAPWVYPNLVTALRGLLSAGPAIRAIEHSGEKRAVDAVVEVLDDFRQSDGSYRLENTFHYLVARA